MSASSRHASHNTLSERLLFDLLYLYEIPAHRIRWGKPLWEKLWKKYESEVIRRRPAFMDREAPAAVERVKGITADEFIERYLKRHEPVVLEGFCRDWPAAQKWNFNFLIQKFGRLDFPVPVEVCSQGTLPLEQVLEGIRQKKIAHHVNFLPLLSLAPELKDDLNHQDFRRLNRLSGHIKFWSKFFIGPAESRSSLHMDFGHNFFANITGTKTMHLFAHRDTPFLYPSVQYPFTPFYIYSKYFPSDDFGPESRERFPLLRFAREREAKLSPGDVLFIPLLTWHYASYHEACIGFSNWWLDWKGALRKSALFSFLGLPLLLQYAALGFQNRGAAIPTATRASF